MPKPENGSCRAAHGRHRHDLNNLLQGILGALDVIKRRIAEGRIGELEPFLTGALESANRAATLTHRLLAFSRRQPVDPRPVDFNALIGPWRNCCAAP
jgi:signal transduction histidine kinase